MRNLKDQIKIDAYTFLNPRDFGEDMLVDGVEFYGQWDEEYMPVKQYFGNKTVDDFGVYSVERLLFIIPKDLNTTVCLPVPGQQIEIDKLLWYVQDSVNESGITKLTLYRNES